MHFVPLMGIAFPLGDASGTSGDSLSARYGWQWVPLELGFGAKVTESVYVGAYLDLSVGYEGSDHVTKRRCEAGDGLDDDLTCSSSSAHLGVEARYTINPTETFAGWFGYGIGYTAASQSISDAGRYEETSTVRGFEFARLSLGLDMRLSRGFGMGPFAVASLGRYLKQETTINDYETSAGSIDDQAFHCFLTLGYRLVIFP
ncbi:MAG TPA: hypothetical protein VIW29_01835 [Polyangiaceae bacterium]